VHGSFSNRHSGMNFDPQKFFIGLMDFFFILLPSALLSAKSSVASL
jgi:hypothetical protein